MLKFISSLFGSSQSGTGALEDPRLPEEKEADFTFNEIVASAAPVEWKEKEPKEWRVFLERDQDGSYSCVAQTLAHMIGILRYLKDGVFIVFSASYIYKRRVNNTSEGMIADDAWRIVRSDGATLDLLMPSQKLTEQQINSVKEEDYYDEVGKILGKVTNYVTYRPGQDFETIASTIQKTGKPVMVWFRFGPKEFFGRQIPKILNSGNPPWHHSVLGVDTTLYNGKKYLVIQDSSDPKSGFSGKGIRLISEEFYRNRNSYGAYPIALANKGDEIEKPKYSFTRPMVFVTNEGPIHAIQKADVVALQNILKYEGLFPTNVESTGYYGALTAKNVLAFQKKYSVASDEELESLKGRVVGPSTLAKLNSLYNS